MSNDDNWMESIQNLGEEPSPEARSVAIPADMLVSWAAYAQILKAGGGFDCVFGIMTFSRTIVLGVGYSLGWSLQRGAFTTLVDGWNKMADNDRDRAAAIWSGCFATDEDGTRLFVVDWELFPSIAPRYGFSKARIMLDPNQPARYGAINMDDAPNFPPWRSE